MKQENKIVGLYPLTKFYLAIVLVVLDIIMPGILSKLVVFVIINIIAALSDVWKSFIRKVRNSVGVLFVILLFIQTFFYPRGEVIFSFWIFNAKLEGILFALKLGITLMGVGGSLIWFFSVTQEKDFVLALEKSGMSAKASYVVLSTLQMVPVLKKKSQTIMNAQKARGVVEYASMNAQSVIGQGVSTFTDDGSTNMAVVTGATSGLGNGSGIDPNAGVDGKCSVSYRGEENLWGNIWTWLDAINIYNDKASGVYNAFVKPYGECKDDTTADGYKALAFNIATGEGYISGFGYDEDHPDLFLCAEHNGASNLPVGDYYWNNNDGFRVSILTPVLAYAGLTAQDLTTWSKVGELIVGAISNPYVLSLVVVSVWNTLNDPTTKGLGDSARAKSYTAPQ